MSKYKHLFEPLTLGKTLFRNRIFAAPIGLEYYPCDNNRPGDDFIAFFERKAQGGAATVCVGSAVADFARAAVGPSIRLDDPDALPPLFRLSQCISRHGAVADIEIQHAGANSYYSKSVLGNEIYGAFDSVNGMGMQVSAMPEDVILDTIDKFGNAAQTAKHCGFGTVTIHAGHGWLFNQFLGDKNNRNDRWGGSLENRARFVVSIAQDIKKKCGSGFPVCIRISGSEMFEGGYDIDYGVEIAKQLDGYFDLINVSVGAHEAPSVFTCTHPSMFLEDGANVKYAAAVKKAMKYSKVSAVGAIAEPELMEEIIASGSADVVALCRQLMADPDTPVKAQTGRENEIRKCIRCFECFSHHFTHKSTCCAINPEIGFEREIKYADAKANVKKTVLVAGGGVAGMQAALTAAQRGHSVTLCEKSDMLGGTLRCERLVPFKQNLQKYLDRQSELIKACPGIDLRLNTPVTPELARSIKPDVIIAAFGARPAVPDIAGIDGDNVMSAEYAYMHAQEIGERVVILGGGLSGIELAIYLAGLGKKAAIMQRGANLKFSGNTIHSIALNNEIARLNIQILTSTKPLEITSQGVVGEYVGDRYTAAPLCDTVKKGMIESVNTVYRPELSAQVGGKQLFPADTVVYAMGQIPVRDGAEQLRECCGQFFLIGDSTEAKNVYTATSTAFTVARDIGRY